MMAFYFGLTLRNDRLTFKAEVNPSDSSSTRKPLPGRHVFFPTPTFPIVIFPTHVSRGRLLKKNEVQALQRLVTKARPYKNANKSFLLSHAP